jgi:hypothetical protein
LTRIIIKGWSFVDGQEKPLIVIHDVETDDALWYRAARDISAWLEECDFSHASAEVLGHLEVEVINLCQVR